MNPHPSIARRKLMAMLAAMAAAPAGSLAQSTNPVRVIVNSNAGSGIDATVRALQQALGKALGAPVVVDNLAGASGLIGLQTLARAPADGNTIGFATANLAIFPSVLKSIPFDVASDLTPIALIGDATLVVVANPAKINATNAKDFVAALIAKPEAFNYGSSGSGTILHLATELLLLEAGVKIRHIPYKGAAPMLTDTIGGQVDFATAGLPTVLPYLRSGALRAIGVCTQARAAAAPEIPTFVEQGFPGVVARSWVSALGPKGMGPAAVKKLYDAIAITLKDPAVQDALAKQGMTIEIQSPEQAQAVIRQDLAKYAKLTKQIGLEAQ